MSLSKLIIGRRQSALPEPGRNLEILRGFGQYQYQGSPLSLYPSQTDWNPWPHVRNNSGGNTDLWSGNTYPSTTTAILLEGTLENSDTVSIYEGSSPEVKVGELDIAGIDTPLCAISDYYTDGLGYKYGVSDVIDLSSIALSSVRFLNMYNEQIRATITYDGNTYQEVIAFGSWGYDVSTDIPNFADSVSGTEAYIEISRNNGFSWVTVHSTGFRAPPDSLRGAVLVNRTRSTTFEPTVVGLSRRTVTPPSWGTFT